MRRLLVMSIIASMSVVMAVQASHIRSLDETIDRLSARPCVRYDVLPEYRIIEREVSVPVAVHDTVTIDLGGEMLRTQYTKYEIDIMAHVIGAEALNQDMIGKRLVADVLLNRVESDRFPNTVEGVVYQHTGNQYQFAVAKSDLLNSKYIDDDCYLAIYRELADRLDRDVMFFQRGGYHSCGKSLFRHGDHYFSGLREVR